ERGPGGQDVRDDGRRRDEGGAEERNQKQEANQEDDSVDERGSRPEGALEVMVLSRRATKYGAPGQLASHAVDRSRERGRRRRRAWNGRDECVAARRSRRTNDGDSGICPQRALDLRQLRPRSDYL